MKIQAFLKIAVVATAALAAYAFSNTSINTYKVDEGQGCRNIQVACDSSGLEFCFVQTKQGEFQVWSDLNCTVEMTHTNSLPIPEIEL